MSSSKGRKIAPRKTLFLDLPPSCIEFCPADPEYFIVGTYNLQKEGDPYAEHASIAPESEDEEHVQPTRQLQSRNGSLVVFRLVEEADIVHVQTIPRPSAILDLHFHPAQGKRDVIAVVSSTGTLSFFRFSASPNASNSPVTEIATHRPLGDDDSLLFLSCAWHPKLHELLAFTTSDHHVYILRVDDEWGICGTSSEPIITHTLEVWTVAFSPFLGDITSFSSDGKFSDERVFRIFSGGDDSQLLTSSGKYQPSVEEDDEPVRMLSPAVNIKGHEAGVTAILPLALKLADGSGVVITGSYDDRLRIYSIHTSDEAPSFLWPKLLAEQNLGGGVWRLRLVELAEREDGEPSCERHWSVSILASCMHAGARILEVSGDYDGLCSINVLGRFEEHHSMNYGSDSGQGPGMTGGAIRCVSTSFYDRLLCLWEFVRGREE